MTTYTSIPNADIDQDSPVTQPLMTALRDNPIAITEGASGAPRIVAAAIEGGSSSTSGQVYYSEGDGTGLWGNAENIEATKDITGTDGYVKLPGGVIMQWGSIVCSAGTTTITFPIAFPNACFSVTASPYIAGNSGGVSSTVDAISSAPTTTSVVYSTTTGWSLYWMAVGY